MSEVILNHPTVKEMIEALAAYPPEAKLIIDDADTQWAITIIHITNFGDEVRLYGEYPEMEDRP